MSIKIYHNPRCSKSRQALGIIRDQSIEPDIIEYLKTPLNIDDLRKLIDALNLTPKDVIRKCEQVYKDLNLKTASDDTLVKAIAENPILLERPIVHTNKGARIGRPPENIKEIL